MFNNRQSVEIIDKLIELTQHDLIVWRTVADIPHSLLLDSMVDVTYLTDYLGRTIRVYYRNYKYYLDEEKFVWDGEVVVDFVGMYGESMGRIPKTPNADELFRVIQFQNPKIQGFYKDLLG